MNLQEQFEAACNTVNEVLSEREQLVAALEKAQEALKDNQIQLNRATRRRDELSAALSIVPKPKPVDNDEQLMANRQAVFQAIRTIPGVWIQPMGLATLAGVDEAETASILRRAVKIKGVPLEHNGLRGRASKYRWFGDSIK